jgi:hypothetical protein
LLLWESSLASEVTALSAAIDDVAYEMNRPVVIDEAVDDWGDATLSIMSDDIDELRQELDGLAF